MSCALVPTFGCSAKIDVDSSIRASIDNSSGHLLSLACSHQGNLFAAGGISSFSGASNVVIYDAGSRHLHSAIAATSRLAEKGLAFSPDDQTIAFGSDKGSVKLCDVNTGRCLLELNAHTDSVRSLAYFPGGRRLASAGLDGRLIIWNLEDGTKHGIAAGYEGETILDRGIWSMTLSPDGKRILTQGGTGEIKVWDASSLTELFALRCSSTPCNLRYSPDGAVFVSAGMEGVVKVWDARSCRETVKIDRGKIKADVLFDICISPDSRLLACAHSGSRYDRTRILIYDLHDGRILANKDGLFGGDQQAIAFTPEGTTLITAARNGKILLWSVPMLLEGSSLPGDEAAKGANQRKGQPKSAMLK
jgi:WD40 repeat protein